MQEKTINLTVMDQLGIIIVNWNGKNDTLTCLASLKKMRTVGFAVRIYVVDNGSQDDSVASIKLSYPDVTLIQNSRNLGFSGGNNEGLKAALRDNMRYCWLLNNDTIVHPDAAIHLVTTVQKPGVGIVGSKIYFAPGREFHSTRYNDSERGKVFWYAGGCIDWNNVYASHRGVDEVDHGQYDELQTTQFVTGCSMMIRTEVIRSVGLLNDAYYLYWEDVEYCMRARKSGFELMYEPKSIIWHVNAGSSDTPGNPLHEYYVTRNRLFFGFTFASMRTKIALVRQSCTEFMHGTATKRKAITDAFLGRSGGRYVWRKKTM